MFPLFFSSVLYASSSLDPVAVVGGEALDQLDLNEAIDKYFPAAAFHGGVSPDARRRYLKQGVELMIERELLYRAALERGMKVGGNKMDALIKPIIDRYGSEDSFKKALEDSGISWEKFIHKVKKKVMVDMMLEDLKDRSHLTDSQLKGYYETHPDEFRVPPAIEVWHILIKVPSNAPGALREDKKQFAQQIAERAKEGEDFSLLAEKHSNDDYRVMGGRLGMVHRGQLVKDVEDVVYSLKKGEVAGPIETIYGYHIVKVGGRQMLGIRSFDKAKEKLKKRLEEEKYAVLKDKLVADMKAATDIKILIEYENAE